MPANDLSQKIRDLRAKHNLTLEQVAQQVGVGRSTVRKWETGMIANMRRDKIAKLAVALHTTPAYLMGWGDSPLSESFVRIRGGSGYWDGKRLEEMRNSQGYTIEYISSLLELSEEEYICLESDDFEPSFELLLKLADAFACDLDYLCHRLMKPNTKSPQYAWKVPLIGTIACGAPILAEEHIEGYVNIPKHISADFALTCKGDSMSGARIFDGDIVYIRQQDTVDNGQIAAVLIDGEATLKRVKIYDDHIVLEPENPHFRPLTYWAEEMNSVRILGRAVAFTSAIR